MIKVLEKTVADKIAAGEVIERPLSIVKELVENSIDSEADSIVVEIKNGGKNLIRVTDNGCGIEAEDVATAFLRHATSKIETATDLNAIETLGFRGEALASITAVTRTEMITKTKDSKTGRKVIIHGGEIIENSSIGCPDGTTIITSDLFYNTPARRKFMKSDNSESSKIIEFMSQIALAYPEIKFRLINNDNILFSTKGDGNRKNTIMSVYKQKELENLVPILYNDEKNKIEGYISKPSLTKTTKKSQIFFVNGRVVNSKVIEKGINEGYKERLFEGRFPITFLFLETNPESLDVNIHPNKKEVRFDKEDEIVSLVSRGIKEALSTKEAVTNIGSLLDNSFHKSQVSSESIFIEKKTEPIHKTIHQDNQVDIKQLLSIKRETDKVLEKNEVEKLFIEEPSLKPFDFDDLKVTGVIFGTYITATDEKNFYLLDQHAAHERIFYEKLVGEYLNSNKLRQPILTPIIIEVPLSVKEEEYTWLDSLEEMGFSIEEFGDNSYVIREIPTFMEISEAENFVKVYIENLTEGTNLNNKVVIDKLITKSCKSAVKAHDYLSMPEIQALVDRLKLCRNPFSCPHGRPTFIKLSIYEIERMFKRV